MADVPLNVGDRVIFNANQAADTVMGQSADGLWRHNTGGSVVQVQPAALTGAAIAAAIAALPAEGGEVLLPTGGYTIDNAITIAKNNVRLVGVNAVLNITFDGPAILLNGVLGFGMDGHIRVRKVTENGQGVGIRMVNCQRSILRGFEVEGFGRGVHLIGDGAGCNFNQFFPRLMKNNTFGMTFGPVNGGVTNQNLVMGGFWLNAGNTGTPDVPGAFIQMLQAPNTDLPNGNAFYQLDLSGSTTVSPQPNIGEIAGAKNVFQDIRSENTDVWIFSNTSSRNVVNRTVNISPAKILDSGVENIFGDLDLGSIGPVIRGRITASNLRFGDAADLALADNDAPQNRLSVESDSLGTTVGLFLPVGDDAQNTRAWIKLDAQAKTLDLHSKAGAPGDEATVRLGTATQPRVVVATPAGNLGVNTETQFGGGEGVIGIANASQTPTADPSGGGVIYVQGGALFYVGSSGTVTKLADA